MIRLEGLRLERARASRQFEDGTFHNTAWRGPEMQGSPLPLLGEYFFGDEERTPRRPLPLEDPRPSWLEPIVSGFRVTWLGHSTLLLEMDGVRVLTDPVFGERASPLSFAGPKRFHATPVRFDDLPPLDAVLLSHDHYDHLCAPTMRRIARLHVPIVTSLGVGAHLEKLGVDPGVVVELDWWERHALFGETIAFTATPAQHFSGRGVGGRNRTLWSSWVLETAERRVFFSGDTGLTEEFRTIGERLGPFDLTMLEIGAFHESWGSIHLGPKNAFEAFRWLGGGALLPVHWGTFNLALHAWNEPAETLYRIALAENARLLTPLLGRPFEPREVAEPTPWWRGL